MSAERLRGVVFGVIDARIVEVALEGYETTEPDRGWDCGIEAASLKEIRSAIAAALAVDAPADEVAELRAYCEILRRVDGAFRSWLDEFKAGGPA